MRNLRETKGFPVDIADLRRFLLFFLPPEKEIPGKHNDCDSQGDKPSC